MKHFKYETHMHTRQGSECGISSGAEMADYYKVLGYSGFVVTDHFFGGNITRDCLNKPWEQAIESFCSGYEDAKERGEEMDFDVFFGFEYAYHGTEFIILGLDKDWLLKNPDIIRLDIREALTRFREAGGFLIHAHPYRERFYIPELRLLPELTDAVEVINICNMNSWDKKAAIYAEKHDLIKTSGGDAHAVGMEPGGVILQKRARTAEEFIKALKEKTHSLVYK